MGKVEHFMDWVSARPVRAYWFGVTLGFLVGVWVAS